MFFMKKSPKKSTIKIDGRTINPEVSQQVYELGRVETTLVKLEEKGALDKGLFAAISAAVAEYMTLSDDQVQPEEQNEWRKQGYFESMNIRQLWQQRGGLYAGSPVSRRAYPLLAFHHH